jgi:hypothetical protein
MKKKIPFKKVFDLKTRFSKNRLWKGLRAQTIIIFGFSILDSPLPTNFQIKRDLSLGVLSSSVEFGAFKCALSRDI